MIKSNVFSVNAAPKHRHDDNRQKKHVVGVITPNHGGVCWVRDEFRHDPADPPKPKAMSNYWKRVEQFLFKKW